MDSIGSPGFQLVLPDFWTITSSYVWSWQQKNPRRDCFCVASLQDPLLPGEDVWPVGLGIVYERECKEKIPRDDHFFYCMSIWQMLWFIIYCYILMCICVTFGWIIEMSHDLAPKEGLVIEGIRPQVAILKYLIWRLMVVKYYSSPRLWIPKKRNCCMLNIICFFGPHLGVLPRCRGNHMEHLWVILQIQSAILAATLGFPSQILDEWHLFIHFQWISMTSNMVTQPITCPFQTYLYPESVTSVCHQGSSSSPCGAWSRAWTGVRKGAR